MKRIILAGLLMGLAHPAAAAYVPGTDPVVQDNTAAIALSVGGGTVSASGSATLSTSAADVWVSNSSRLAWRLQNTDFITDLGGAGYTIWCRWGTAAGAPAAPHGVGSFMLVAGQDLSDSGAGVSRAALNCVAENGTPIVYAEQR